MAQRRLPLKQAARVPDKSIEEWVKCSCGHWIKTNLVHCLKEWLERYGICHDCRDKDNPAVQALVAARARLRR